MATKKSNFEPNLAEMARARERYTATAELQDVLTELIDRYSGLRLDASGRPLGPTAPSFRVTASVDPYVHGRFPTVPGVQEELNAIKRISPEFDNVVSVDDLRKRLTQANFEQELNRLAEAFARPANNIPDRLYNPGLPTVLPGTKTPPTVPAPARANPAINRALGALGPLGTLLDLLTFTSDLNANEDAELQKRRAAP